MSRRIVAILFDGFLLLDLAGPTGAFQVTGHFADTGYELVLVSAAGGAVSASCGTTVQTSCLDTKLPIHTLIVPGGPGVNTAINDPETLDLIRRASAMSARSASVCTGALLLAAVGLLDGRRATTHWGEASRLGSDYPMVSVDADRLFIDSGGVWTSAGITAGIDLALAMVECDHGFAIAQQVARAMVVPHRRSGGEGQFSVLLDLQEPSGRFGPLLEWMRLKLDEPLGVEKLAARCNLSPRQFSRAFAKATGLSPALALERIRVERAYPEVCAGEFGLETVARRSGFGSAARMRRAFIRVLGQPPQVLRQISSA